MGKGKLLQEKQLFYLKINAMLKWLFLPNGIYLLHLQTTAGESIYRKVVVQH
ncbi:MAG: hypothetical protein R2798_03180 [Chitinophagales bacterium]|nr:hypothetical protein [Bacteroidota bacterium]MCB9044349.1 hypothetical protein [Chitinophagales bacterium]